ncbi:MAG: HD domain-containing protein [Nanoarchaeota archaeon]|nr:HD domain-containing protein [Nanoarchaeota archaeon]
MKKDIELLYEIGCLRHIPRAWKQFLNSDFANLSEHIFRVIWIAMVIAKHENADVFKVMKMALVHDIPESRTGDAHYMWTLHSTRDEDKALIGMIGDTSLKELISLHEEYKKRETKESKIVKDADNLDVDLELQEQYVKGNKLKKTWKELRERVYELLFTETAKKLWKEIQESDPHSWHTTGSNKFTDGEWKR